METPSVSRERSGAVDGCSCSCIDLDEGEFSSSSSGGGDRASSRETEERCDRDEDEEQENRFRFMDLGDRVTSAAAGTDTDAPPPLDAFRLRLTEESSFLMAHRWIRRALTRRPAALVLRRDVEKRLYGPKRPEFSFADYCRAGGAFTCRLRTLHLRGVALERGFAGAIAAELPVLEDLRLEECDYSFARIASTSLRHLAINGCAASEFYVDVLVLAAPRLASLRVRGSNDPPPPVDAEDEMPSLAAASLEHPAGVDGLLRSLRHARDLSLYRFGATALLLDDEEQPGGGFPVFRGLRNLVLDECDVGVECRALRRFLRNSPGLETLALRYCSFSGGSRRKKRKARSHDDRRVVPASYECKKLKWIELEFHEDNDVSELDDALEGIMKKVLHPIECSVQNGQRTVRISYE